MIVDWQTYYDAAKKCHDLADDLRRTDKPVHDAVKGKCAGMAGDAPGCKEWGKAYDTAAQQTMQACSSLANALTNYGTALYAMGYNYGIANKSNPAPTRPAINQVSEYSAMFDGMDDRQNLQLSQDHFITLKNGADTVATATQNVASPIGNYHDATVALGHDTSSAINTLETTIVVTAVVGAIRRQLDDDQGQQDCEHIRIPSGCSQGCDSQDQSARRVTR
ncbi:hypothetical protein [Nocardia miyunensis]|uniref:hypothetical protein n=1 Tax=Nocardia miyunensis TaxID=282684 RepID=UPI0008322853|nr:hypothetical protein [Nocardia miyunensis]